MEDLRVKRKKLEIIHLETENKKLTVFWNNWCKEPGGMSSPEVTVNQECDATMKANIILVCVGWAISSKSRGVLLLEYETLIDVSFISNPV